MEHLNDGLAFVPGLPAARHGATAVVVPFDGAHVDFSKIREPWKRLLKLTEDRVAPGLLETIGDWVSVGQAAARVHHKRLRGEADLDEADPVLDHLIQASDQVIAGISTASGGLYPADPVHAEKIDVYLRERADRGGLRIRGTDKEVLIGLPTSRLNGVLLERALQRNEARITGLPFSASS